MRILLSNDDGYFAPGIAALAAALLTTLALALSWWMEPPRRIRRALLKALGAPPEVEAVSPREGRACALNFDVEQVVVLWANGAHGLAYAFEEVEGGEIIVDGHVVARIRRGEPRKSLDVMAPDAEQVVLRLMSFQLRVQQRQVRMQPRRHGAPRGGGSLQLLLEPRGLQRSVAASFTFVGDDVEVQRAHIHHNRRTSICRKAESACALYRIS